jgi:hypothetical protein
MSESILQDILDEKPTPVTEIIVPPVRGPSGGHIEVCTWSLTYWK